ncbi:MAG: diguanylate cyclase [Candidatus Hydrogenedens sp.]|nr:diguanylate cyclase [Candidatus Hydrogenedens sp.]
MMEAVLIAAVVGMAALTLSLWYLASRDQANARRSDATELDDREIVAQDAGAVSRSKEMLQDMMAALSGQVEGYAQDVRKYNRSLESHRKSLEQAHTMKSIRDIEAALMREVDSMRKANAEYRDKLEEANKTIARQQQDLEQLAIDAKVDFLTKVPNRRAFDMQIHEEIERYRRGGQYFSLALIDIDHFKQFNDKFGHSTGDEVLRAVARVLNENRRTSDFVARYGGEEFAILLPNTGCGDAAGMVEKLRAMVERLEVFAAGGRHKVTFSAGVAELLPADGGKAPLVERADARLYAAKAAGRNQVVSN